MESCRACVNAVIACCAIGYIFLLLSWNVSDGVFGNLQTNVLQQPRYYTAVDQTNAAKRRPHSQATTTDKIRVILFCYMRGGSTFFSELFHQNKEAMYWYEPFTAFYNTYFGMDHWIFPLDVFWQKNPDGSVSQRAITEKEYNDMDKFNHALLYCNFSNLPVDVFFHNGLTHSNFNSFKKCIKYESKRNHPKMCHKFIKNQCRGNCINAVSNNCKEKISTAKKLMTSAQNSSYYRNTEDSFLKYGQCMNNLKQYIAPCVWHLEKTCREAKIITHKGLRITMESIDKMLEKDGSLRVIYDVRDPRGTVSSRLQSAHLSNVAGKNTTLEAKYLCNKMMLDLKGFQKLQAKFPNSVLFVKYEDLIKHPYFEVDRIYKFLGIPVHSSVSAWMIKNQESGEEGGNFDTRRANSSASIDKWKRKTSYHEQRIMTEYCADILQALNYSL